MKIFYVSSVLIAMTLVSCQEDNSFFNELTPIRAYDTDTRIMAQFVEVDKTTGTYVLNPDKKITASDYVINKSREELMEVSQINKDRFLREMEEVNNQLSVVKRSGLTSSFIYSTQTADVVIDGDEDDSFILSRRIEEPYTRNRLASLILSEGERKSTNFFSQSDMVMTVSAGNSSAFYCAQVTLGDQNDEDAEIIYISGVKSFIHEHSYRLVSPSIVDSNKTISGMTVIGAGNISVSISR